MNHWLQEATQAASYAKHGWPTADQKAPKRQSHLARQGEYEAKLKSFLRCVTKPMTVPEMALKSGVIEGTSKKYAAVLFKRRLLDRKKRGTTFYYWRITKNDGAQSS